MRDTPQCFIAQPLSSFSISWSKARGQAAPLHSQCSPCCGHCPLLGVFLTQQALQKQSWEPCLFLQASEIVLSSFQKGFY